MGRDKLKAKGEELLTEEKQARCSELGETEVNGVSCGGGVEGRENPLTGVEDLVPVRSVKPGRGVEGEGASPAKIHLRQI